MRPAVVALLASAALAGPAPAGYAPPRPPADRPVVAAHESRWEGDLSVDVTTRPGDEVTIHTKTFRLTGERDGRRFELRLSVGGRNDLAALLYRTRMHAAVFVGTMGGTLDRPVLYVREVRFTWPAAGGE